MRMFMTMVTLVGILGLTTVEADVIKKQDVPKYIEILKSSPNAKARASAAEDLGHRGAIRASDVEDAIDPLINGLMKDKEADVRKACAQALGDIATEPEKCVAALTEALKDSSAAVKIAAIQALGQFGGKAQSAVSPLRDIAKNKDDKKLSQAANLAVKSITGAGKKKN
jgi:HEAT repeat protein